MAPVLQLTCLEWTDRILAVANANAEARELMAKATGTWTVEQIQAFCQPTIELLTTLVNDIMALQRKAITPDYRDVAQP